MNAAATPRAISIIIPTYNRAELILATLRSVKAQDYPHFECLIVDDYSTDNTFETVQDFIKLDARFKYVKNLGTKGAPAARNTGIKLAQGEFITFLDSDDLLLTHALSSRLAGFNDASIDVVIGNQARFKDGKADVLVNIPSHRAPLARFYSLYPLNDIPWVNATLIKRSFLIEHQIFWLETLERFQDIQFNIDLLLAQPKYNWLAGDIDSLWVRHPENKSIGNDLSNYADKLIGIALVYLDRLKKIKTINTKQFYQLFKQVKIFSAYNFFDLATQKDIEIFADFLRKTDMFSGFDQYLLRQYHHQSAIIKRTIRLNFRVKLRTALGDQQFLQIPYVAKHAMLN